MIIGFVGNVRSGKTLSAVRELYKLWLKGYKIYSNIHLTFEYTPLTRDYVYDIIEKDIDVPDLSVFFVDEIHLWIDSRQSTSKSNRILSYFITQTGKQGKNTDFGLIMLYTTQYPHQIDRRLRSTTDIFVSCNKFNYHNTKIFVCQYLFVYKNVSYVDSFLGEEALYSLYNTREKVKYERSRYEKD